MPRRFNHIPADDSRVAEGARLFDAGRYFEGHEVWESLWHEVDGPERDLLKGLIQLAAAHHHRQRGNAAGARRLYATARSYLAPWLPAHAGLALATWLAQAASAFAALDK